MVRLLLFLATATVVVMVETVLAVRGNRTVPNYPLQLLNLLPLSPEPLTRTHTPAGFPYFLRHLKENSVALPGRSRNVLPKNSSPGVLKSNCLQILKCQYYNNFNFGSMEIHHADLPERSAEACGHLCLRQRPETQLVMVHLNPLNERLVCGCGDETALNTITFPIPPRCSQPCPDGGGSCGGSTAVSVYQLDRDREECVAHQFSYLGCYYGEASTKAITLGQWERWAGGCMARCWPPASPQARLIRTVTTYEGVTLCECWLTEEELGPSAGQTGCGWSCPDGAGWCGGPGLTSVYKAEDFPFTPFPTPSLAPSFSLSSSFSPSYVLLTLLLPFAFLVSLPALWKA